MALSDVRPDAADLIFRPATTVTRTLEWPTGSLAGRSFTSTLAGQALALSVVDDTMTVVADDVITGALITPVEWLLLEDIAGTNEPVLIGAWTPSNSPRAVDGDTLTVTVGSDTIQVTTASAQASVVALENQLTTHEADQTAHGDPLGALATHEATFFTPNITRPAAWGQRWFTARDEADTRQVRVHLWGGSITNGVPGPSDPLTTSWSGRVEAALRAAYGDGGSGYRSIDFATRTGTWIAENGFAAVGFRATGAATATWTGLAGTDLRLFHRNVNLTGSFRYRIDGGSFVTVTPPTGFGVEPGVVAVSGLADTPHTVDVEWVSGTIIINGVEASRATGIVTARCAYGGRAYGQYARNNLTRFSITTTNGSPTITCTAPGFFNSSMVGRYLHAASGGLPFDAQIISPVTSATSATINANATASGARIVDLCVNRPSHQAIPLQSVQPGFGDGLRPPDLLILCLGVNDMAETGGSTTGTASLDVFRAGLANLIRGYYQEYVSPVDFTPDLVVLQEHLANFSDPLGSAAHIAATGKDVALGMGGAHVDFWGIGRRNFRYAVDQGWMADVVHVNDAGAQAMANPVIALLTS